MPALALTKPERVQVEAAAAVLDLYGFGHEPVRGGKHLKILVRASPRKGAPRGVWSMTLACTPRNEGDAATLARQQANRLVRDILRRAGL